MAKEGYFSHISPRGKRINTYAKGYEYRVMGENLARNYTDAGSIIKAWMNSPSHRANILDKEFRETGIGIATAKDGTIYVVQVFGRQ